MSLRPDRGARPEFAQFVFSLLGAVVGAWPVLCLLICRCCHLRHSRAHPRVEHATSEALADMGRALELTNNARVVLALWSGWTCGTTTCAGSCARSWDPKLGTFMQDFAASCSFYCHAMGNFMLVDAGPRMMVRERSCVMVAAHVATASFQHASPLEMDGQAVLEASAVTRVLFCPTDSVFAVKAQLRLPALGHVGPQPPLSNGDHAGRS